MEAVHRLSPARRVGHGPSHWLLATIVGGVLVLAAGATYLAGEPARRWAEAELNSRLKGYSVQIDSLSLHPLALSVTLRGFHVRQDQHPEPPIVAINTLTAGVHWRALLHLRVVGDIGVEDPQLRLDRSQFEQEADDAVPIADKGFQEAVDVFPLEINQVWVTNGSLTWVDEDKEHPLELSRIEMWAENIRNVRSPGEENPSSLYLDAALFEQGTLRLDGQADFLAEPSPTYDAEMWLASVPLGKLGPLATQANLEVSGGVLAGHGRAENTAKQQQTVHLEELTIDKVKVEYLHTSATEAAEARRLALAKETTEEIARKEDLFVLIDHLAVRNSTFGYRDRAQKQEFELFLSRANLEVWDVSTRSDAKPARIALNGDFMGVGPTRLDMSMEERNHNPALDLSLQIENTPMKSMNNLFRSYGNFDVVAGDFAFYTQIKVKDQKIEGYVKPMFSNVDVYDLRQDADKALFRQVYEGLVGGAAALLENKSERVATEANLKGRTQSPRLSLWEVVVNLVRNAFFKAILPGFDRAVRGDEERG